MLYAIRWLDKYSGQKKTVTGASIPDSLHRGQMIHGANFTFSDMEYGIMSEENTFIRVPELDEPGLYTPEEMTKIVNRYYDQRRIKNANRV